MWQKCVKSSEKFWKICQKLTERFKGTKLFFQFVQFDTRSSYSTVMIKIPHIRNQESPEYQSLSIQRVKTKWPPLKNSHLNTRHSAFKMLSTIWIPLVRHSDLYCMLKNVFLLVLIESAPKLNQNRFLRQHSFTTLPT